MSTSNNTDLPNLPLEKLKECEAALASSIKKHRAAITAMKKDPDWSVRGGQFLRDLQNRQEAHDWDTTRLTAIRAEIRKRKKRK